MEYSVQKSQYKISDKTFDIYLANCNSRKPLEIILPLDNCQEILDEINKQDDEWKTFPSKYNIYIDAKIKEQIQKFVSAICDAHNIDNTKVQVGYGTYHAINRENLCKVRMASYSKGHRIGIGSPAASNVSIKLFIHCVKVYCYNDNYYVNAIFQKISYIKTDRSEFALDPNSQLDYRPIICELNKLKTGYKPYISQFSRVKKNKIMIEI